MAKLLVYYAHPGHKHSHVNKEMWREAQAVADITLVDLYGEYPRFDINVEREQQRLLDHDIILFQFPMFWYSTPSLIKEWQDLVLEHGFAYGAGGTQLAGKTMMLAVTAAGPANAFSPDGYQHYPIRTFLTPLERTARLCNMAFPPPYVLHGALTARENDQIAPHVAGYHSLLSALRDERYDLSEADNLDIRSYATLPITHEAL